MQEMSVAAAEKPRSGEEILSARFLLVDDQESNLILIERVLQSGGFRDFTKTTSPEKAVELFKDNEYDIVLLDLMMPGMDGFAVMQAFSEAGRNTVPVLVVSAAGLEDLKVRALESGARDFLDKPFSRMELVSRVRNILQVRFLTRNLENQNRMLEEEVEKRTRQFLKEAVTDSVTELPNLAQLQIDLLKDENLDLLCINLESLTDIHYAYGLETSDRLLRAFARMLRSIAEKDERVYRYSSDQFVIACRRPGRLEEAAETLNRRAIEEPIRESDLVLYLILSLGIVWRGTADMLKRADQALHAARGRGFVAWGLEETEDAIYRTNLDVSRRVIEALRDGRIVPYFQPLVENRTGRIAKFESLARLMHMDQPIPPGEFLPAVKRMGIGHLLTHAILSRSLKAASGTDCSVSINLSEQDFRKGDIVQVVEEAMKGTGLHPSRIVFEVLEDMNTVENPASMALIQGLKAMGCLIAIDDFGTNYSNFASVLDLAPDFIKIDGAFIRQIHTSERSMQIARSITHFAHDCGVKVVAEYVHCAEVMQVVKELEIDFSQGYYVGMPSPHIGSSDFQPKG